ncbi:MAG: hypothetical protein CMJ45_13720 [Planctomyces sp.]|nr:hypothetical protein [Planctomyces sp.]MDP7274700.1 hypothetical protein [Planctomycetaceae bacterium]
MTSRRFLLTAVLMALQPAAIPAAGVIREHTGAHTRIVWVQDSSPEANDTQAQGAALFLMGLDSDDGRGERRLLDAKANYARPLMTADGQRVVFTDRRRQRVLVIHWNGDRQRVLARGMALAVWREPGTRTDWVVIGQRQGKPGSYFYRNITRVQLDAPEISRPVWSKTRVSPDNFQLSRSGRHAAGVFPWPNGGLAQLDPPTLSSLGKGCWTSLAPDDSRLAWVFDGPHRHLRLVAPDGGPRWKVAVEGIAAGGAAGGGRGDEMFHPRWSNHVRHLVLTGPYRRRGPINVISGGGPQVEVYLARFSKDFRTIEASVRISRNSRPDFFPDAWIASGMQSRVPESVVNRSVSPTTAGNVWAPRSTGRLLWAFHNTRAPIRRPARGDRPAVTFRVRETGRTRPGRFFDLRLSQGAGLAEPAQLGLARHWNARRELTLSLLLTLGTPGPQRPGVILAIDAVGKADRQKPGHRLALAWNRDTPNGPISLVLELDLATTSKRVRLGEITPGSPTHVVVSLGSDAVTAFHNGRPRSRSAVPLADLELVSGSRLWLGNNATGNRPVEGRIAMVTVTGNQSSASEARALFDAVVPALKTRSPNRPTIIRARCLETSPIPTPARIAPYRRAVVYHHYRVERVESGRLPHRDILVGDWAILDGKSQPGNRRRVGRPVRLTIEPLEDHAQLDSERQILEVEHVELPQYISTR